MQFDGIISNPPYSASWSMDKKFEDDPRFADYKLAPKRKADWAFILDAISRLSDNGTLALVLPHGVLFRGNAEEKIRTKVVDENLIDAIIGLPENLFDVTTIPVLIMVIKKHRAKQGIYFIDASNEFEKGKNQNSLTDEQVTKILKTYSAGDEIERYAHFATIEEIKENDYNLNIPRYVDTYVPEPPVDIIGTVNELKELDDEIEQLQNDLAPQFDELVLTDPDDQEGQARLDAIKEYFNGLRTETSSKVQQIRPGDENQKPEGHGSDARRIAE